MEIHLNQPDKSCWQFTAKESDQILGSIIFSTNKNRKAHLGYIALTQAGKLSVDRNIGTELLQSCLNFCESQGCESLSGTLIPVPGCEHAMLSLAAKFGLNIDKKGRFQKQLPR